jgi:DNA-binding response OmpR family regulator
MNDQPAIVMLVPNLMFATQIEDAARAQHAAVIAPSDRASFLDALLDGAQPRARLVLIDANSLDPAWLEWVTAAKDNPASELVPVLAFGSHTNVALRDRCLDAGVDRYMARSNFVEGLSEFIAAAVRDTTDEPCGEPLPAGVVRGLEEFNEGKYFEQHETLELVWRAELRPVRDLYRGILQIGVACLQIERGNAVGAIKLIDRATRWLQAFRPACQTVDVERLLADTAALRNEIERAGLENVERVNRALFPTVHFG